MPDDQKEETFPENLDEWRTYINNIPVHDLTDKAYAANGLKFVELLQEEGFSPQEIDEILYLFAKRLDDEETTYVPTKGPGFYCSYQTLLEDRKRDDDPNRRPVEGMK